jgi:multiple sugar transport system ATP-binding protein
MAAVLARDIIKTFGEIHAVDGISLAVPDGEFMVLLGPSGCGKTTFLRIICGLEQQTSGDLMIGGHVVNDIPPRARGVAMMFQSYGLYPHYTVRKNIGFPLRTQGLPSAQIAKKVEWASQLLGIGHLLDRRPRCFWTSRCRTLTPSCAPRPARRSSSSSSGSASPRFT